MDKKIKDKGIIVHTSSGNSSIINDIFKIYFNQAEGAMKELKKFESLYEKQNEICSAFKKKWSFDVFVDQDYNFFYKTSKEVKIYVIRYTEHKEISFEFPMTPELAKLVAEYYQELEAL